MKERGSLTDLGNGTHRDERFLGLFMANQKRIFGFIAMLVPCATDADDIMQETATIMWRKFDDFKGGDFAAWGMKIARFRVLKFHEQRRDRCLQFSKKTIEEISKYSGDILDQLDDRMRALQGCLGKLDEKDRELVRLRYEQDFTLKSIAENVGRSVDGIYKTMSRIHYALGQCVKRTIAAWEMI